jgi:hypothetical protein
MCVLLIYEKIQFKTPKTTTVKARRNGALIRIEVDARGFPAGQTA